MVSAYILMVVQGGHEKNIVNILLEQRNVQDAQIVYGQYDIVVKVKLEDASQLRDFMLKVVRAIPGVQATDTLIVVD